MAESPMPGRIVHMLGGLRTFDVGGPKVSLGLCDGTILGELERPKYPILYASLEKQGLQPVGVEFLTKPAGGLIFPSDWRCFSLTGGGFYAEDEVEFWSGVRHNAVDTAQTVVADLAGQCETYLRLL